MGLTCGLEQAEGTDNSIQVSYACIKSTDLNALQQRLKELLARLSAAGAAIQELDTGSRLP